MIYILGAGPSGLFAALACINARKEYRILSNTASLPQIGGCQYLHDKCDINTWQEHDLLEMVYPIYMSIEEASIQYSEKQYGRAYSNSIQRIGKRSKKTVVYDLHEALSSIWDFTETKTEIVGFGCLEDIAEVSRDSSVELVISTIPLNQFVKGCLYSTIVVNEEEAISDQNFVVYNAVRSDPIVRWGNIFGRSFTETFIPVSHRHLFDPSKLVKKVKFRHELPSITKVMFAGRYGAWDKNARVDTVYRDVRKALENVS